LSIFKNRLDCPSCVARASKSALQASDVCSICAGRRRIQAASQRSRGSCRCSRGSSYSSWEHSLRVGPTGSRRSLGVSWAARTVGLADGSATDPVRVCRGVSFAHFASPRLAQRGVFCYRNGLARIEGRWVGTGQRGERFNHPHHAYATDLDLFGLGGLFELLSTARARTGRGVAGEMVALAFTG
jgi:hypothetical protein